MFPKRDWLFGGLWGFSLFNFLALFVACVLPSFPLPLLGCKTQGRGQEGAENGNKMLKQVMGKNGSLA